MRSGGGSCGGVRCQVWVGRGGLNSGAGELHATQTVGSAGGLARRRPRQIKPTFLWCLGLRGLRTGRLGRLGCGDKHRERQ